MIASSRSQPSNQPSRRAFLAIAASSGAALSLGLLARGQDTAYAYNGERFRLPTVNTTRELRGAWIASVANINWPRAQGSSIASQQKELRDLLDKAKAHRLNAVFLQVRPLADALYRSALAPWSAMLTGTQGKDPGWDPLAFAIVEAHKRGLQLHAWLNPYRISQKSVDVTQLAASNIAVKNPSWRFEFNGGLYFNPGVPEVHAHLVAVVSELTRNYDVDGVHFDDYFYPYPVEGQSINDAAAFAAHAPAGQSIGDWRRGNVNRLVQAVNATVHRNRPYAQFGISPFGIWRNRSSDPRGSDSTGLQGYDSIYADAHAWVANRWVDYIAPQVYWDMNLAAAAYSKLVPWWANLVKGTGVRLYIGEATYKIGSPGAWSDPQEMMRHLALCAQYPQIRGNIWYNADDFFTNRLGSTSLILNGPYKGTAARSTQIGAPARPNAMTPVRSASGIQINILNLAGAAAERFTIYRATGNQVGNAITLGDNQVVGTAFNRGTLNASFLDTSAKAGTTYTYFVTAVASSGAQSAAVMAVAK